MSALRLIVLIVLSVAWLTQDSVIAGRTKRRLNALEKTVYRLSESLDELVDSDNATQAILHDIQRSIETLFSSQDSLLNADEVTDARQSEMNSTIQDLEKELQVCSTTVDTLSDELNSVLETVAATQASLNRMNTSLAQHLEQENWHWDSWGSWSSCDSETCGVPGLSQRQRTCSASTGGACIGDSSMQRVCNTSCDRYAFKVLRSKNVTYRGYNFLALEVRVPADGLSRSPNWCYDYQYLCEDFNRRPTGCGSTWASSPPYSSCRIEYNSDMNIDGSVLSCNPSGGIAEVANIAFQTLSPPAQSKNAFGFHACDTYCSKTLQASEHALTDTQGFWQSNMTIFYTVCH